MISHDEFMSMIEDFFGEVLITVDEKARRYNGAQDDAFFTARVIEHFGVCDAKTSIVARIIEKIARLSSTYRVRCSEDEIESVRDTLQDICGHVARLAVLIELGLEDEEDGEEVENEGEDG